MITYPHNRRIFRQRLTRRVVHNYMWLLALYDVYRDVERSRQRQDLWLATPHSRLSDIIAVLRKFLRAHEALTRRAYGIFAGSG